MTNSLVGDHQIADVDIDEGVLEGLPCLGPILMDSLEDMYNMLSRLQ